MVSFFTLTLMINIIIQSRNIPTLQLNTVSNAMKGVPEPLTSYYYDNTQLEVFPNNWTQIQFDSSASFTGIDPLNTTQTLQNWADWVYEQEPSATVYGNYFLNAAPSDPTKSDPLQVAVYGNLKSMTAQNVYGSLVLE